MSKAYGSPEPQISQAVQSRAKGIRGNAISLEEFQARYKLKRDEARRLFDRFGPSALELDLLMQAKKRPAVSLDPTTRSNAQS